MTISLVGLLILLFIAGLCGAVGRAIAGGTNGGCLVSIALGFIGALLGSWLAHRLRLPEVFAITVGREHFPVLWSIIGAALFVALGAPPVRRPEIAAHGAVAHAASPEPPASVAHVDHLILGTRDLDEGICARSRT